ncbi:tRNA 2-selenouridine(34) synthase MnmH [Gymnodinialimonas ceratoperidinii]|uniref:tRNA 2-selenouridine(34) synthase MnmH n=1 Tax=Gymnodinialimonas ceratoperidinii TaxID=2856823 RepID=A0A8F6TZN8_9RHOB|nr:tRNA 2-selenouridine(34) synthase MnmH [Gymnodinialimonas ceratoperidinii]QXT40666.1 tRNA 2-selenouridine(34) synthase MnmH [Gymnodinialimonas ceratoperidinii]
MAYSLTDLPTLRSDDFDTIIDVRTPAEFAEDHVPGAINMPVLSNAERAEVGTIYTQESPFKARKIGATRVARNAANAIETHLLDNEGGWRPLVYCWRGGQRSGSFASILQQIGWRAEVLEGGYQSWRRHVVAALYDGTLPFKVIRLDGYTGTAKTELLNRVARLGPQVLDLEGLARHRGSILGDIDGDQPAQKGFETVILTTLSDLDPARPLLVEAESARIGTLRLPPALWVAMKDSPRIVVEAAPEHRARFLADAYRDLVGDPPALITRLNHLRAHAGHATVDKWLALLKNDQPQALARALIEDHYDPAYARLTRSKSGPPLATIEGGDLGDAALDAAAAKIARHLF